MEVHKSYHNCATFDWWKLKENELFNNVFEEWVVSDGYNEKESIQILKLYWDRFPSMTRQRVLQQLGLPTNTSKLKLKG